MFEMLKRLEAVQEIDLQILNIQKLKTAFPTRLAAFNAELLTINTKIESRKKQIEEHEKMRRQHLGAIELNESRAKRSEAKASSVTNAHEAGAIQKEIESFNKNNEIIAANIKKIDEQVAALKAELEQIESSIGGMQDQSQAEAAKIQDEENVLNSDIEKLTMKRTAAIEGIDRPLLISYDRIRNVKGGVGLAFALSGHCRSCNLRLPPQMYNELQRKPEIQQCPNCKRILMYKDAPVS